MTLAILVVAAFLTATLSGILGMGGGMTLLAIMTLLLPAQVVVPIHGVVQLASNGTRTVVFLEHVSWKIFAIYVLPLVVGISAASTVWSGDKLSAFKPAIGVLILAFLVMRFRKPTWRNLPLWVYAPLGLVAGFLSIFVGATGPLISPFFLRDDLDKEEVIATKAMCQAVNHALKVPAFLALGFDFGPWLGPLVLLVVAVMIGTTFGKWLLTRISRRTFERAFLALLSVIAGWLIVSSVF